MSLDVKLAALSQLTRAFLWLLWSNCLAGRIDLHPERGASASDPHRRLASLVLRLRAVCFHLCRCMCKPATDQACSPGQAAGTIHASVSSSVKRGNGGLTGVPEPERGLCVEGPEIRASRSAGRTFALPASPGSERGLCAPDSRLSGAGLVRLPHAGHAETVSFICEQHRVL